MQERRSHPRIAETAVVTVIVKSAPEAPELEGKVFPCRLQDISTGGMKLWVDIPVPVGATVELEIVFNRSPETFRQLGMVVWAWGGEGLTEWHNIGVRFETSPGMEFLSWEAMLSKLAEGSDAG